MIDDENIWIERARNGDRLAFSHLCEKYRKRIWCVVASVTRRGADTEDLAQEAILRAYASLRSFRAESSFEAWLCRIALNAAHDYQRSAWRRRVMLWGQDTGAHETALHGGGGAPQCRGTSVPARGTSDDPHKAAEQRELKRRVRAAVAALGPKERVPIWLIYFEEFTLADVARLEAVPESTVRSRVKVGLRRLERTLGDLRLPDGEDDAAPSPAPLFADPTDGPVRLAPQPAGEWKGCRV